MRELQQRVRETLETAQKERVVITPYGEPVAIVVGVEGYDWEDVFWATNADLWKLIQRRSQEATIPLAEVREQIQVERRPDRQ